tara:strand:+ start:1054 stop:1767 length:714 start_codon:yes stop_codon:yes gene_type:complete
MKYKIILFFFLTSCINSTYVSKNNFTYSAKGFAVIKKQLPSSVNNEFFASHNKLRLGTKIRITNPFNEKSIDTIVRNKNYKYDNFYKVLISTNIANELKLNFNFPYVEISEIKKNKSFIAKKAKMENVEKKIANKAPVTKININNLSKPNNTKKVKPQNYSILVAEFYSLESAKVLKKKLAIILKNSNYQLIYINRKNNKSYELLMGPYNTINKLKNDYIVLNDSNFEDLDIKINDH